MNFDVFKTPSKHAKIIKTVKKKVKFKPRIGQVLNFQNLKRKPFTNRNKPKEFSPLTTHKKLEPKKTRQQKRILLQQQEKCQEFQQTSPSKNKQRKVDLMKIKKAMLARKLGRNVGLISPRENIREKKKTISTQQIRLLAQQLQKVMKDLERKTNKIIYCTEDLYTKTTTTQKPKIINHQKRRKKFIKRNNFYLNKPNIKKKYPVKYTKQLNAKKKMTIPEMVSYIKEKFAKKQNAKITQRSKKQKKQFYLKIQTKKDQKQEVLDLEMLGKKRALLRKQNGLNKNKYYTRYKFNGINQQPCTSRSTTPLRIGGFEHKVLRDLSDGKLSYDLKKKQHLSLQASLSKNDLQNKKDMSQSTYRNQSWSMENQAIKPCLKVNSARNSRISTRNQKNQKISKRLKFAKRPKRPKSTLVQQKKPPATVYNLQTRRKSYQQQSLTPKFLSFKKQLKQNFFVPRTVKQPYENPFSKELLSKNPKSNKERLKCSKKNYKTLQEQIKNQLKRMERRRSIINELKARQI